MIYAYENSKKENPLDFTLWKKTEEDIESYEQLQHFLPRNYITKDEKTDQADELKTWN